jgi:endogenous inhibitor of DNA gyrase (YacG/DUF329 family)
MSGAAKPVGATPAAPEQRRRARPCPICGGLAVGAFHPFCSKRCADVDLNRWLSGVYAIPAVEEEPSEEGGEGSADR